MKSAIRKVSVIATVLIAVALLFGAFAIVPRVKTAGVAIADTDANIGRTYYYDELGNSELAQRFYQVFAEMADDGTLKSGNGEYDLTEVLTQSEIAEYVEVGTPRIPVAFSSARDAFYMDHPDLFYADVYKLYLTAGTKGSDYVALVNSGNADNYFVDNTVNSETEANKAISEYENALKLIVDEANTKADDVAKIQYVNEYICKNVEYDYGARANGDVSGYVSTAYGALVEKKAMCGGYSRAFKAVMDRLNIPCVLIQGYVATVSKVEGLEGGYNAHMWNAVLLDGLWYGVDTTYNSSSSNISKYLLVGDDYLSQDHFTDGVISSSGFELDYPALRPFDYGVNEDKYGFTFKDSGTLTVDGKTIEFGYVEYKSEAITPGNEDRTGTELVLGVSYNGKDAKELYKDGKYLAYRNMYEDGTNSYWLALVPAEEVFGGLSAFTGEYTVNYYYENSYKVQYAVFDCAPNTGMYGDETNLIYYNEEITSDHIIAASTGYVNDAYGTYIPAPYVKSMTPESLSAYLQKFDPVDVAVEYTEKLVYAEGTSKADLTLTVTGMINDGVDKYVTVENVVWDEQTNTLSFRFTPSKQFIHNCETYQLVPSCLVGERSGKAPYPALLSFKRKQVICPKVFNDGRLYMMVYGYPTFVGAEDLSLTGFQDANGQPVTDNLRSQLMLVVNDVNETESKEMMDELLSDDSIGLEEKDIKGSSTYQIDLQVCGCVQKVPDGSYMQVGFGFPDGYGPNDAGVTFMVYHYTRNPDGTVKSVEQIPCVVTEYGIIATVKSFSPFMICAVDSDKVQSTKNIYASVSGVGGSIDKTVIQSVADGESVSYTLTADSGYQINTVLLNGKDVTDSVDENGKLTLAYSELTGGVDPNSNILEVSYISTRVKSSYDSRGITVVAPKIVVTSDDLFKAVSHNVADDPAAPKSRVGLVIGIVVAIMIVLAAAGVAVYFVFRNKKSAATAKKSSTSSSSKISASKKTGSTKKK